MHHLLRRATTVAVIVAASACGPFHLGGNHDAYLVFDNQSPDQVDVYALNDAGGSPIRIGTVFAGRRETLRVPDTVIGGTHMVNIVARIFASTLAPRSGAFPLAPGDSMMVRLSTDEKTVAVLPVSQP